MNKPRAVLLVVLLSAACAVLTGALWRLNAPLPADSAPRPEAAAGERRVPQALAVLRAWDARRAAAWASGDVAALRALYTPGSAAGAEDRRMLQQYVARGLVVEDLRTQVLSARIASWSADELQLVVTDRLAGGRAVSAEGAARLPRDLATTRRVTLVRDRGSWLVDRVE